MRHFARHYAKPLLSAALLSVRLVVCRGCCVVCVVGVFLFFQRGKEKNEVLEVGKRHTLLQTLVGALACSGLQMCVPVCWF